jgi:hypothetical protein
MSPEKRNQLLFLSLVTGLVLVILYLTVIAGLRSALDRSREARRLERVKLDTFKSQLGKADGVLRELEEIRAQLTALESRMPSGDAYDWLDQRLDPMTREFRLEDYALSKPRPAPDVNAPTTEYGVMQAVLEGTAPYAAAGSFVAHFENEFPFAQVQDLLIESVPVGAAAAREAGVLTVKLQFATLAPGSAMPR